MAEFDQMHKDSKRRKLKSVSPVQTAAMLDFLERHPELAVNKCRPNAGTLWTECAETLNALADSFGGPTRTGAQWSKFFSDLKYRARRKALELKIAEGGSGPGEEMTPLTPLEERLLRLIGEKGMWATVVKGGSGLEDDPLYVSDSEGDDNFCVPSDPTPSNNSGNSIEDSKTDENNSNEDTVATQTDKAKADINTDKRNNNNSPNTTRESMRDLISSATYRIYEKDSNSKHARNKIPNGANSDPLDEVETRENRKRRRVEITENNSGCNNERPQMNGNGHSSQDFEEDDNDNQAESFLRLEERKVANMERIADAVCALRDELAKAVDVLTDMQDFLMQR